MLLVSFFFSVEVCDQLFNRCVGKVDFIYVHACPSFHALGIDYIKFGVFVFTFAMCDQSFNQFTVCIDFIHHHHCPFFISLTWNSLTLSLPRTSCIALYLH